MMDWCLKILDLLAEETHLGPKKVHERLFIEGMNISYSRVKNFLSMTRRLGLVGYYEDIHGEYSLTDLGKTVLKEVKYGGNKNV